MEEESNGAENAGKVARREGSLSGERAKNV